MSDWEYSELDVRLDMIEAKEYFRTQKKVDRQTFRRVSIARAAQKKLAKWQLEHGMLDAGSEEAHLLLVALELLP